MSSTHDPCSFVAVSNTSAKICCLDAQGKATYPWQESGQQPQGSVNWLRNGKAFLTTQGGNVAIHVLDTLKEKAPNILSLPAGPLQARVGGDGKCLVVVQSGVPGAVHVYDLQSLLGSTGGAAPAKPPVVLQDHDRPILALAASTATTHVASSNAAGSVYLHDAGSGVRSTLGSLPGGTALMTPKRCLAFSQASKPLRLAAGADDGQVLVWQITPNALGPLVMHTKLRGRVMGVGFAAFNRMPGTVLLSCSESGQLSVADMRSFPNIQATFSVELNVAVSCMAVREDGQVVAVGTKDGRVGLLRVDDLLAHKQNLTKAGLIKVFELGTHLDVVDLAFQRVREPRESRDAGLRDSRDNATPGPATTTSSQQQQQQGDAASQQQPADGTATEGTSVQRQGPPDRHETPGVRPGAGLGPPTAAAAPGGQQRPAPGLAAATPGIAGPGAATTSSRPVGPSAAAAGTLPGATPVSGLNLPGGAAATPAGAPAAQAGSLPQQQQTGRPPGVPQLMIPPGGAATTGAPVGVVPGHRRPSDMGGSSSAGVAAAGPGPGTAGMEDVTAAEGGQGVTSPAARALGGGAGGPVTSPVASPSRPRSPRATMSGGGYPPARLPLGSTGGDALSAAGLRGYLDDFRQEVRDLVRGLQADMVRQSVTMEMAHRGDLAVLQQENRQLREEVARLSQQLDGALRFGLLNQQGPPW